MRYVIFLLLVACIGASSPARSQGMESSSGFVGSMLFHTDDNGRVVPCKLLTKQENPRLVAIALDVTLGLFGMHRLYLGTDLKLPMGYTLTFGGGGVLWFVDLVMLIATPDITPYMNNPHFFMWIPAVKPNK
jgi:hypothetical protein